jgi:hypothetical protein
MKRVKNFSTLTHFINFKISFYIAVLLIINGLGVYFSSQVENQTGIDLVCRFDHGKARQEGVIESWGTDAFLIRYIRNKPN